MRSLFEAQAISVGELCRRIRRTLRSQFPAAVRVFGEISKCRKISGNLYFSLKDREGYIDCICFEGNVRQLDRNLALEDGLAIEAEGFVEIYEPKSAYQLRVTGILPVGRGALHVAFEQLKARLAAEGLFDEARKRKLPAFIRDVAIVTSKNAAVLADFETTCRRRGAHVKVWVVHSPVQGEVAAPAIARAIAAAGKLPVDVIVVARGGGTIEDLWAYNTEQVARAIAASPIPIITAIGHQTDLTIADLVADKSAATATAAAEFVTAVREALLARITAAQQRLRRSLYRATAAPKATLSRAASGLLRTGFAMVSSRRQKIDALELMLSRLDPRRQLRTWRERTKVAATRLPVLGRRAIQAKMGITATATRELAACFGRLIANGSARVDVARSRLLALGPRQTLQRGYAIVYDSSGGVLTHARSVRIGENIGVELTSGWLEAQVKAAKDNHGEADGETNI
jgi:exodeoxyribonuclease VII large subunit